MVKYNLDQQQVLLSDADRTLLDKKINRLEKYIEMPYVLDIRLVRNTHHVRGDVFGCILNLEHKKDVLHAEREGGTVHDAIDEALEALQQALKKNKDKNIRGRRWIKRLLRRS